MGIYIFNFFCLFEIIMVSEVNIMGERVCNQTSKLSESFQSNVELMSKVCLPDSVTLNERLLCDLELLSNGSFAPLTGFMGLKDYLGCCKNMRLENNEVFPMPIVLPVSINANEHINDENIKQNNSIFLRDKTGLIVATLHVNSIFKPDLAYEALSVLGTASVNHPHVKYMFENYQNVVYVGGPIEMSSTGIKHYDFPELRKSPAEIKERVKGFDAVVGFQTRNPMHRAHMELTIEALRDVTLSGAKNPHLLLTPAVGPTQPGDVPAPIRIKCYKHLLPYYKESEFPEVVPDIVLIELAMRMGGPREAIWHAIIRRNYGCTHFIVGRDHAGPSTKTEDGNSFYGPYEAHALMESVEKDIGIKVCYAKMFVYCGEEHGFKQMGKVPEGLVTQNVSGTMQREILMKGEDLPMFFTFPEISRELKNFYKPLTNKGFVLYLTGLSASGKTTIAEALRAKYVSEDSRDVTVLDGDIVRTNLCKGLGFDRESRSTNVRRIGYVASLIAKSGGIAICANIAPYEDDRLANKSAVEANENPYVEVFVDTPLELCEARDVKGLYQKARAGIIKEFTGISDPYEAPRNPCVTINADMSITEAVEYIHEHLKKSKIVM